MAAGQEQARRSEVGLEHGVGVDIAAFVVIVIVVMMVATAALGCQAKTAPQVATHCGQIDDGRGHAARWRHSPLPGIAEQVDFPFDGVGKARLILGDIDDELAQFRLAQPGEQACHARVDGNVLAVFQDRQQYGDDVLAVAALLIRARAAGAVNGAGRVQMNLDVVGFVVAAGDLRGDDVVALGHGQHRAVPLVAHAAAVRLGGCAGADVGFTEVWHNRLPGLNGRYPARNAGASLVSLQTMHILPDEVQVRRT